MIIIIPLICKRLPGPSRTLCWLENKNTKISDSGQERGSERWERFFGWVG